MEKTNAERYGEMMHWINLCKVACNRVDVINQFLPLEAAITERSRSGGVDLMIGGHVLCSYRNWDVPGMERVCEKLDTLCDFVFLLDPYM